MNTDRSHRPASTIPQFCVDHGISRTLAYELIKSGRGPRLMKLGRRVLISAEAAAVSFSMRWRHSAARKAAA